MNNVKEVSIKTKTTVESANSVFKQITDKLDGEQITRIAISVLKYGTICFVAYICGTEGIKALSGTIDIDNETIAA